MKIKTFIKKRINLLLNKGSKYLCPFCGYSSNSFYPKGLDNNVIREKHIVGAGRREVGCYNCDSTERERLVYIYLKYIHKIFDLDKKIRILHVAPEKKISEIFLNYGFDNYVCGDLLEENYKNHYSNHVMKLDLLNINFSDNRFDLIICNHVLEHIIEDHIAIAELYRVMNRGGYGIFQVPISLNSSKTFEDNTIIGNDKREAVFGQSDHVRIYGRDYVDRLSQVGFNVNKINISKQYQQFGLNIEEDLFIVMK